MREEVKVLELDKYELNILINALNQLRTELLKEERTTEVVDELLIKAIDAPQKKRVLTKTLTRDNARRY